MNIAADKRGFTIIEVVLVLAIAGLIFLMVFVALPALQSGQRDTARKSDVSTIASAVTTYGNNNRGTFPTTQQLTGSSEGNPTNNGKFAGYAEAIGANTTNIVVAGNVSANQSVTPDDGQIIITTRSRCGTVNGKSVTMAIGSARQFSVITYLEAGGGTAYCQDS